MPKISFSEIIKRNIVKFDKQHGIFNNGDDNLYPQRVEALIKNSVTAKAVTDNLASFLVGDGFENAALNDIVIYSDVNGYLTLYDFLSKSAKTLATHNAVSAQVQYNALFEVAGLKPIPYRNCRFGQTDSFDYSGFIYVYNNWDKKPGLKYNIKDAKKINTFNPNPEIVAAQFKKSYLGQISILRLDDEYVYPLAVIDSALEDADTEAQIKGFKNGELRKGFFAKYILYHTAFSTEEEQRAFKNTLKKFEGGDHDSSILMAEAEFNENGEFIKSSTFQLQKLEQNINDKIFESFEKSVANNIRKAAKNCPSILIEQQDTAFFGTSGEALRAAFDIYNAQIKDMQKRLSGWIAELLKNSDNEILRNADYTIKKLTYGTVDNSGTATN